MSLIDTLLLFLIMTGLAIMPSSSVALVITRSISSNTANGIAVALGILLGDLIFIFLAIFGLSFIAETMGNVFLVIRYLGGIYLLWFGYTLLSNTKKSTLTVNKSSQKGSLITSFSAGLLLTLGDIKAIVFYISLFPTFVDLTALNLIDTFIILLITIIAVGGVKIVYACLANRVMTQTSLIKHEGNIKKAAGGAMLGIGSFIIAKT